MARPRVPGLWPPHGADGEHHHVENDAGGGRERHREARHVQGCPQQSQCLGLLLRDNRHPRFLPLGHWTGQSGRRGPAMAQPPLLLPGHAAFVRLRQVDRGEHAHIRRRQDPSGQDRGQPLGPWLRVCKCIVLLFAMEHNYICDQLTKRYPGKFTSDEELYQQARVINCGVWVGCIKREYIGAIAGIFPEGGQQGALLRGAISNRHTDAAGFHVTLEFNIMYQFHNIPEVFDPSQLSNYEHNMEADLHRALTHPAGAFGAFNVPGFLLPATANAIKLCREKKLQTFNDFRRGVGLPPHKSFAGLSKSPRVQEVLAKHYDSPDHIELAVGLIAEDPGPDGWGLSSSLAFAILADALSSGSHDRFYTSDYTPEVYTPWGYEHANTVNTADLINRHTSIYVPRDAHLTQVQPPELWGEQHSVKRVPPQEMTMK
uniref:Prostaglandin-endoperoxide synthase n=1 Tax=Eutreptiella gymnastica TaxID=73025 RepID=A0A7S1N1F6_9EUGL|mmetsp:Transcript_105206/g.181396  ORF Transcript_105206/g.181396 Transcript_105206/m.181396 type:complete len:430 (+) Transcript_105206:378-1667(+)